LRTAVEDLDWIYARWSDLRATFLRGTPKPWREPTLTPEQRGRLDQLARIEKIERGAFTLGESPAPIHLDAFDRAMDLTTTMARLARAVATELGHHAVLIRAATHRYDDPLSLITYVRNHFGDVGADNGEQIQEQAARIRGGLQHHFSEIRDGQRLKADCPWCDRDELHVRTIGPPHRQEPVIRCESGLCDPPQDACSIRHRNMPAWAYVDWEWLAGEILHADAERERKRLEELASAGLTLSVSN
jgi:hypothetical protein